MSGQLDLTLLCSPSKGFGAGRYFRQMENAVRASPELADRVVAVGSVRGPRVDRRLPAGLLTRLGPRATRVLGSQLWWGTGNVHRLQMSIPPAPREIMTILGPPLSSSARVV